MKNGRNLAMLLSGTMLSQQLVGVKQRDWDDF